MKELKTLAYCSIVFRNGKKCSAANAQPQGINTNMPHYDDYLMNIDFLSLGMQLKFEKNLIQSGQSKLDFL